jgi:hypothetical protein
VSRQPTPPPAQEGELPRLRDLPAEEDLAGVSELVRAAASLPAIPAVMRQRVRARLRRGLGSGGRRGRRWWTVLRPALVVVAALMSASVGGAAMYSVIVERRLARESANESTAAPLPGRDAKRPARGRRVSPNAETREGPPPPVNPLPPVPRAAAEPAPAPVDGVDVRPFPPSSEAPRGEAPRGEAPRGEQAGGEESRNKEAAGVETAGVKAARLDAPAVGFPHPLPARVRVAHPREVAMAEAPNERVPGVASHPELTPPPLAPSPPPPARTPAMIAMPLPAMPPLGPRPAPANPPPGTAAGVPLRLPAAPVPSRPETEFLADALRLLRAGGDPDAALASLDELTARFPRSALAPEVAAVRIEALLRAGRSAAALAELDRAPLEGTPGNDARLVVRGELRAQRGRWREAEADFARALGTRLDGARDDLAERALWGRAAARARLGNAMGAAETCVLYLQRFPSGRFAESARRLSRLPPSAAGETP